MIIDYSKFERVLNLHGKVAVPEGDSERIIEAQIQPNDDCEIKHYWIKEHIMSDNKHIFFHNYDSGLSVIIETKKHEKQKATVNLLSELANGEKTAAEKGWLSEEESDAAIAAQ